MASRPVIAHAPRAGILRSKPEGSRTGGGAEAIAEADGGFVDAAMFAARIVRIQHRR